uniref:Lamina-associated polypeptide 2 alpha C-terminal domain-containing protein n=1 Tax=Xenopus tropicalis TaxID=8364 RepID=A0A6I8RXR4_XENTR
MAEGRGDLFSKGGRKNSPMVSFFACTKCLNKFKEGQSSPLCPDCSSHLNQASASHESVSQGPIEQPIAGPSSAGAPIAQASSDVPAWAVSLSNSLAGLQCIPQLASTIDKMLEKLSDIPAPLAKRKRDTGRPDPTLRVFTSSPPLSEDEASEGEVFSSAHSDSDGAESTPDTSSNVDHLIRAVLEVLQIEDADSAPGKTKSLFKKHHKASAFFPAHDQLQALIQEEWQSPEKRFHVTRRFTRQYPFPKEFIDKWSVPPVVDAPVSRLSKATTLPVPDASAFKDPTDKKLEGFLKAAFSASGSALLPILASAWVSRAIEAWASSLLECTQDASNPQASQLISYILEANAFVSEAALDAARLMASSSALSVAARRALWLKMWSADLSSKKSLISIPFKGSRLFGEELEKIISQATGGKSTLLPQNRPKSAFNPRKGNSFRSQSSRNYKGSPPSRSSTAFKQRFPNKGRSTWQPRKPQAKPTGDKAASS